MIAKRLEVFTKSGLLRRIPTRWQIVQGTLEMTPYVASTDATAEPWYRGAPFGHPLVRQPLIISRVGIDHFRTGAALGAKLESLIRHLHLTYHQGMPVFDLQVVQTHDGGLQALRERTEEVLAGDTRRARRHRRFVSLILPRADDYYRQFLGDDGWIARAERLDYPRPDTQDSAFPPEFFSLVEFLNYCAETFPEHPRDIPWTRYPSHLAALGGRRFREGRGFGWFSKQLRGA
jgi:hypothetical protein